MRRALVVLLILAPTGARGAPSLYGTYCQACHGEKGDGAGPATPWLWPKPRDFTRGRFKWRSTASGKPPTDDDLARVIRKGAPGTSMPGFEGILDESQVAELVAAVKAFAPARFAKAAPPLPAAIATIPNAAEVERGRGLFGSLGCAKCHGDRGRGDGPSAATLKDDAGRPAQPFDLTNRPLRRPGGGDLAGIHQTLVTGLDATPMPSFGGLPEADLWALAGYVDSIRWKGEKPTWDPTTVDPRAVPEASTKVGLELAAQGPPPAALAPAEASLSSDQCGRCHPRQLRQWRQTIHGKAASPGLLGQFPGAKPSFVASCLKCHAPLAEQATDTTLRAEGITCAACHVRGWSRHGPPLRKDSGLITIATYPFVEDPLYERADFCLPCHQLAPSDAVAGRPLLNTYREWLEGPYMRRGVQCQHCHMPDREHTWKGVHDPVTVKQGVNVRATTNPLRVEVKNVGAGHNFPTTPTPAAWLEVTLLDAKGGTLATAKQRIGRHIEYTNGGFRDLSDTRIPPGEALTFTPQFPPGTLKSAKSARVTLSMFPDDYYEGFYATLLKGRLAPEAKTQLEAALKRAQSSHFLVYQTVLRL